MRKLKIDTIRKYFLYFLPAAVFFSYYPLIRIGETSATNIELSITVIWLFLFSIISIPGVTRFLKTNFKKPTTIISLLFPVYASISIFWSSNFLRAILTSGMSWCVWISIVSIIDFFKNNTKAEIKTNLLKNLLMSTIFVCAFCWLQSILDVFGISRENTLLCVGCTSYVFGFPHPSGFAIEPQFMGNLLLVPSFISLYFFCKEKNKKQRIFLLLSSFFIIATLFLTMSRGAIYAFGVGILIYLVSELIKMKKLKSLIILPIILASFIFTLCLQGAFSELSVTNDTFISGVSKVINQMSLGIIDIPYQLKVSDTETTEQIETSQSGNEEKTESQFDGYVEISTTIRLNLSKIAIESWIDNPARFIFGSGIGSAGKSMHEKYPDKIGEKEIVQNEVIEIALELGLIGLIILILNTVLVIKIIGKHKCKNLLLSILAAFAVTYMFFSGLPNALHIFLLIPVVYFVLQNKKPNLR